MKIYNLSNIEDIFSAKMFIEQYLLEENKIEEKMELQDFILAYMNVSKKVYIKNDNIIPFEYHKINNEDIIIITNNEHIDLISNALMNINYDISNLSAISNEQLHTMFSNDNYECFIIDNKYKK